MTSTAALEKVKKDLYLQYADELTALVEQRRQDENPELSEEERALLDEVPEHLRVSYPRQRLMCQRADLNPLPPLPVYIKGRQERSTSPHSAGEDDEEDAEAVKLANARQLEALLDEIEVENDLKGKGLHGTSVLHSRMHRLQDESVQRLKDSILRQHRYKTEKAAAQRKLDAEAGQCSGASEATIAAEEGGATTTEERLREEAALSIRIMAAGGVHSEAYYLQRMGILDKLEHQVQVEKIERMAEKM